MSNRTRSPAGGASAARLLAATLALACSGAAVAQSEAGVPGKGHGYVSVAVQNLFIGTHTGSHGQEGFPGVVTDRTVFLNFDYGLSDRVALTVGLPYKAGKFEGPGGHDPHTLYNDHGFDSIDDGDFHSGWQDWRIALRYQMRAAPAWHITPFVAFGSPSHGYNTFAHATLGTGQEQLQLGVNVARQFSPPYQNLYVRAGVFYAVMERVEPRYVNHAVFTGEVGYFFSPKWSASVLLTGQKVFNGFNLPEDYPDLHDEHYFHHDQNLRNDYLNIGASVNYQVNSRYSTFVNYGHTLWGENTHMIDYAWTFGFARGF